MALDAQANGPGGEFMFTDRAEKESVEAVAVGHIPQPFGLQLTVRLDEVDVPLRIVVNGKWKFYRAKIEAYEVNGSYEFTKGNFKGQIAIPAIDRFSEEPGPGWDLLDRPLESWTAK